jgi:hypothetical protein
MKMLSATQQKVLDFVLKSPASKVDFIAAKTELAMLTVHGALKPLIKSKKIKEVDSADGKIYVPFDHVEVAEESLVENPVEKKEQLIPVVRGKKTFRDFSSWKFNGEELKKGALACAIIRQFVKDRRHTTYAKLKEIFPDSIVPTYGVFQELSIAKKRSADKQRFFIKPELVIKLKDKTVAVTNQWTSVYITAFLAEAKKHGYKPTAV